MAWRIYRLPGSRLIWHVDTGPGTQIVNVRGFEIFVPCVSVDNEAAYPRAWIEVPDIPVNKDYTGPELHVIDGIAIWSAKVSERATELALQVVKDISECAAEAADQSA